MTPDPEVASKLETITKVQSYMHAHGCGIRAACGALGLSHSNAARWLRAFEAEGVDGLRSKRKGRCGKKPMWSPEGFSQAFIDHLRNTRLRSNSDSLALLIGADHPECPPEFSDWIQNRDSNHDIPPALRRMLRTTKQVEDRYRGPRTYDLNAFVDQRSMTEIMPDGSEREIQPGDYWELDDMSVNFPFWYEDQTGLTRSSQKQGASVGRQCLIAADVASGKWLGYVLIGRPRDAYRAQDILRFLRMLFEEHGLPRRGLRLERGIWKSKIIKGNETIIQDEAAKETLSGSEGAVDPDGERTLVFGGLTELGIGIEYVYKPGQKGFIESNFNWLQSIMSVIDQRGGPRNIGRRRGEFEAATKHLLRATAGVRHPGKLGFAHIDQLDERMEQCMRWANGTRKEGRLQRGVPDEKWDAAIAADPLAPLQAEKRWIFLPDHAELRIRQGCVRPSRLGSKLQFCDPDLFADLGNGYRVFVRFDATEPSAGAAIFNAHASTESVNRHGHSVGKWLGHAAYVGDAPQFCGHAGWDDAEAKEMKKRYHDFSRTAGRALGVGRAASRREQRDGTGNVSRVERNVAKPEQDFTAGKSVKPGPDTPGTRRRDRAQDRSRLDSEAATARKLLELQDDL